MTSETKTRPTLCQRLRAAPLRRLAAEKAGSSVVFVALAIPMALGMAALGLDASMWYLDRRDNQTLADNIALAATMEMSRNFSTIDAATLKSDIAVKEAARLGFVEDSDHVIELNWPPASGPNAGDNLFLEVIIKKQRDFSLAGFVLNGPVMVEGRSVGSVVNSGSHCVLALDQTKAGAVEFAGTSDANISCGVASNSSSDQSIMVSGSATLTADPVQTYGQIDVSGSGSLTTTSPPQPLSERLNDPYAGIDVSSYADPGCSSGSTTPINSDKELFPGNYCGGLKITGGATRFNPGVYVIDSGDLDISTGGNITVVNALPGEGVTFVLTSTTASKIGTVKLTANGSVTLNAPGAAGHFPSNSAHPDFGTFPGILFFQDGNAPCCQGANLKQNQFTGGTNMTLDGALYFPNQDLVYTGGNANNGACTLLISAKVTFNGTSNIENKTQDCIDAGVDGVLAQTRVRVVE